MKYLRLIKRGILLGLTAMFIPLVVWGAETLPHPDTYLPSSSDIHKLKKPMDDPTDLMATYPLKNVLPSEIYRVMTLDKKEAKRQTKEILGFKSPALVGKIGPGIKPGKYTFRDLEKYPGLKALFAPQLLLQIKPGGAPLVAGIPGFEIIPTRQFYRSQIFTRTFMSDIGQISSYGTFSLMIDHADLHSTFSIPVSFPTPFERKDFTIEHLIKRGK